MKNRRVRRLGVCLVVAMSLAAVVSAVAAKPPKTAAPGVIYSYPHAPDEPAWSGAFQDAECKKLLDGATAGGAQHSVMWATTKEERFVDVDLGRAVELDRVVVRSYKHYTGRDFQLDHVRLYVPDESDPQNWKLVGQQTGYKRADAQGLRDITLSVPGKAVRRIRIGLQNDEPIRLALAEFLVYARSQPDISYTLLAKFSEVAYEPEGPPPTATAADREAGYVLFAPNYLRRVFPNSVPLASERVESLALTAALGEYEPLTVAVFPLQELGRCTLQATDLAGPAKSRIARQRIDVRTVRHWRQIPGQKGANYANRYMVVPELLEPKATTEVKAGTTRQWWLTIHVPHDAAPGDYSGTISIAPEKGKPQRLGVRLRVLPLRLEVPKDYAFGMYWGPWRKGAKEATEAQILAQLRDMREHGMNSAALDAPAAMTRAKDGKYEFDLVAVTRALGLLKQEGFTRPIPWSYSFPPIGVEFGSEEHLRQVKTFVEHARREFATRDLPEVLWYPRDEPWRDPRRQEAKTLCQAVKQASGARTYATVQRSTAEYLEPWLDVRCHTVSLSGGFDDQVLRESARQAGRTFWWYTNACREYPEVMRFKAGFFFWKTGATGQFYWAYQYPKGDPYDDLDGIDWCAAYPGDDGPIPTIEWEALREGIDDFRYVFALERAITQARQTGARSAADEASRLLDELRADIVTDLNEYERRKLNFHVDSIWPAERYNAWRARIAEMIVRLQASAR